MLLGLMRSQLLCSSDHLLVVCDSFSSARRVILQSTTFFPSNILKNSYSSHCISALHMWQMLRMPQLLQNAWYKIPWERQMEWAEEPRRGGSWFCPVLRRPGADPSWLCRTSPTCECTWPENHPALYSSTEGRGCVPALRTHQLKSELPQPRRILSFCLPSSGAPLSPSTGRRNSLQKQPQKSEQRWPGQAGRKSTSIWGETSTSPHYYIKASALGKGESPALKTRNTSWKWIMTFCDKGGSHQNNCLSWAALHAW